MTPGSANLLILVFFSKNYYYYVHNFLPTKSGLGLGVENAEEYAPSVEDGIKIDLHLSHDFTVTDRMNYH